MDDSHYKQLPIDRGWAWIVLLAAFIQYFVIVGTLKSFGLLFVEFLQKYNATSSSISAIIAIQTVAFGMASILVMGYGTKRFNVRTLVITGSLMLAVSYFASAFSPTASFLLFTQGTLYGMGGAISHMPGILILGRYFNKRRGIANSIANVGGSVGGILYPPMLRYLLDYYGLQGALILVSGLQLHIVVCGALMRPINLPTSEESDVNVEPPQKEIGQEENVRQNGHLDSVIYRQDQTDAKPANHMSYEKLVPQRPLIIRTFSEGGANDMSSSDKSSALDKVLSNSGSYLANNLNKYAEFGDVTGSMTALNVMCSHSSISRSVSVKEKQVNMSLDGSTSSNCSKFKACCGVFFNFSLFKILRFNLFVFASLLGLPACCLPLNYIPPFARDADVADDKISYLLAVSAFCDLASRVLLIFIADSKYIKRHQILIVTMFINGFTCMFVSFMNSFETILILAISHGLFGGVFFSLYPVILVDFIGLENLSYGIASISVVTALSVSSTSPVVGLLRDNTGSYVISFYLLGMTSIIAALLLLLEPLARRFDERNRNKE